MDGMERFSRRTISHSSYTLAIEREVEDAFLVGGAAPDDDEEDEDVMAEEEEEETRCEQGSVDSRERNSTNSIS